MHRDARGSASEAASSSTCALCGGPVALAVVLTGVIYGVARLLGVSQFPIVVAVLFALIIAMPLGIWLFSPLRRRATAALADQPANAGAGNANNCEPGCTASPVPDRRARRGVRSPRPGRHPHDLRGIAQARAVTDQQRQIAGLGRPGCQ